MSESWKPHKYQREGIRWMISHACAGLIWDPGLGKTSVALAAFKLLRDNGIVRKALVVAPLRPAQSTWPQEVRKWDEFKSLKLGVFHDKDRSMKTVEQNDITVVNPEGLATLFEMLRGREWPFQVLIVDESTRFKHTNTQRYKTLKPMLPLFHRRYILTGTPAPNGLLDLFGQIFLLDLGNALGPFITHYRVEHFNPDVFGFNWKLKEGHDKLIYDKIKPLVSRMAAEDWLELPELVYNRVTVELPPAARRQYDQMETLLVAELQSGNVTAANAAVAGAKCRQIANGGLYGPDPDDLTGPRLSHKLHDAKTEAVVELVEELQGTPCLVAYEFDHDRKRLVEALGKDTPHIGGGVSAKRFREIEAGWNAGAIPVLLAQPSSVAHGLNLQGTHAHIIRYAHLWDLEVVEQFIRRVWRQGQTGRVVVHDIVAKNTIDEVVLKTLERKTRVQGDLLSALKSLKRRA